MADFDTGDVVRLGAVMEIENLHEVVNVLHVEIMSGGGLTFAAASQDFGQYCDQLYAKIFAVQSNLVTDKHISIKNMTQSTVWGNIAWPNYTGGSAVPEMTAPQVACLAFARTNRSRVQIRKYLGVFTEDGMVDGVWASSVRTACDNWMVDHISQQTMTNGLVLLGVAYRLSDGRKTYGITASTSANPVIQRRRRRGRGS